VPVRPRVIAGTGEEFVTREIGRETLGLRATSLAKRASQAKVLRGYIGEGKG
jgi:hypothetical protein